MTCAELDILLADYFDGTLPSETLQRIERHLAECPACAELARDIEEATAFLADVPKVEPPPELVTRIAVRASRETPTRQPTWRRWLSPVFEPILQPRFAMSMALTVLSFSMVGRLLGVQPRDLRPADLDPAKVWASIDNRAHRVWERTVKYYESLRVVYEVQTRLKEWSEQEEEARRSQQTKTPNSATAPESAQEQK